MGQRFEVICGNIGAVYQGQDGEFARQTYAEYVTHSNSPHGRASGEDVTLLVDGEVAEEHTPAPKGWDKVETSTEDMEEVLWAYSDLPFPINIIKGPFVDGERRYKVVYGEEVSTGLTYAEATHRVGQAIFHALQCAGKIED